MEKIKSITTKLGKLLFVKVEDQYNNFVIKEYSSAGTWLMETDGKELNNWKISLPRAEYEIIGESQKLTEDQISSLGFTLKEYINALSENDITYNYSAWTGKWIVLKQL